LGGVFEALYVPLKQVFELKEEFAKIGLDDVWFEPQVFGSRFYKAFSLVVAVEVEDVHMDSLCFFDHQIDVHHFEGVVFVQAQDPINSISQGDVDGVVFDFDEGFDGRGL